MASTIITTISRSSLTNLACTPAKITDFKHIASYSWHNETSPTISVPGSPALWSPPVTATCLEPDSGTVYIDQNGARCPSSPLEPLFRAAFLENPDFSLRKVDLVTDRNNIRKLLRFVQASSNNQFRILVEVVGGDDDNNNCTALFTRVEPRTMETIQGFCGYGRNFEKAYTKHSTGMNGHHRIVTYNIGGMRWVVRYETDAYIGSKGVDGLSDALGGLSISEAEKAASGLTVARSGKNVDEVPASSLLEIKTRAASRVLDMTEVLPQLWISQTPKLVVAYHSRGVFNNVNVQDMTSKIQLWEVASQEDLGKLAGLVNHVICAVQKLSDRRAVVEYTGGSSIRVVTGGTTPALPDDLYAKWKAHLVTVDVEDTNPEDVKGKESEEEYA